MTSWTAVVVGGDDPLLAGLTVDGLALAERAAAPAREQGATLVATLAEAAGTPGAVVVLDAHCPLATAGDLALVLAAAGAGPAVGVRPVTDTVKQVRHDTAGDWLGATVDRESLVAVAAPLVVPDGSVLAGLEEAGDLAELVAALRGRAEVVLVEVGPSARRVRDGSDLAVLTAG